MTARRGRRQAGDVTRAGASQRSGTTAGFTIVEIVVAIVILTAGIVALASATGQIVRTLTLADLQSERAVAFQTVVDRVQALPYADVVDGTTTIGSFDVSWTVADEGGSAKLVTITTVGPGVSATSNASDPQRSETFTMRVLR